MSKKLQVFFYYFSLLIVLATLAIVIYLAYVILISRIDWYTFAIICVIYLLNLVFNLYIIFQKRHFDAKASWLVIFSIIPFIGHFFYIIYGRKYLNRKKASIYFKEYKKFINSQTTSKDPEVNSNLSQNELSLLNYTKTKFNSPILDFKSHIFTDGYLFFDSFFQDLQKAKKFILIDTYIIKNDFIWFKLKNILINKAKEGVKIRIIVDSLGTYFIKKKQWKSLKDNNIKIIVFNIINFPFLSGNKLFRNHRKVYIIDGETVYTGGNNISEEYAGFDKKYGYWIDLNMKITGSIVKTYCENFRFSWYKWSNKKSNKNIDIDFDELKFESPKQNFNNEYGVVVQSGPIIEEALMEGFILKLLYSATKKVQIFTPYFTPTQKILDALKDILNAKIEVELYLPGKNDINFIKHFNNYFCETLQNKGAKIFLFNETFYHGKAIIIDNKIGFIGTANMDIRSIFSQYEINILLTGDLVDNYLNYIESFKSKKIIIEHKKPIKVFWLYKMLIPIFKPLT